MSAWVWILMKLLPHLNWLFLSNISNFRENPFSGSALKLVVFKATQRFSLTKIVTFAIFTFFHQLYTVRLKVSISLLTKRNIFLSSPNIHLSILHTHYPWIQIFKNDLMSASRSTVYSWCSFLICLGHIRLSKWGHSRYHIRLIFVTALYS